MMAHPGKKLSFMGNEFAQFIEWNYEKELDWNLLGFDMHKKMQTYVRDLNAFYLRNPELWENDSSWEGFRWNVVDDCENNVVAFSRRDSKGNELIAVFNMAPVLRRGYTFGVEKPGTYKVVFSSDSGKYGGTGEKMPSQIKTQRENWGAYSFSLSLTIPPMSVMFIRRKG